jgi:hypothetical protein
MKGDVLKRAALCAAFAVALAVIAAPVAASHHDPGGPLVEGLFNPRGLDVDDDTLFVAESGSGEITKIRTEGRRGPKVSTFATLPTTPGSETEPALGPVDIAVDDGKKYVVMSGPPPEAGGGSFGQLLQVRRNGTTRLVADIAAYQLGDPDPDDLEGHPTESNPNGLAVLENGKILVSDAAANDVLLVDPKKDTITTVARLKPELVPWPAGLPFGPPPGTPEPAEAVPTSVTVGPDGAWYVTELKGFPFVKGTSRIWRIEPGSVDATCDPTQPNQGPCRTVGTGFTSVIDLAFGRHGTMYVLEIVKEGLLSVEFFGGPPIGALWRVEHGTRTELAPGTLLFPGGVAIDDDDLFVTTGSVFGDGAGAVVEVSD